MQGPHFGLETLFVPWRAVTGFDSLAAMALLHAFVILSGLVSRCLRCPQRSRDRRTASDCCLSVRSFCSRQRAVYLQHLRPLRLDCKMPRMRRWQHPRTHKQYPKRLINIEGSLEVKLPTYAATVVRRARQEKESEEKESGERRSEDRSKRAKRQTSHETQCFSNTLWLRSVEK